MVQRHRWRQWIVRECVPATADPRTAHNLYRAVTQFILRAAFADDHHPFFDQRPQHAVIGTQPDAGRYKDMGKSLIE